MLIMKKKIVPLFFILATLIMSIGQVRVGFAASVEPPKAPVITISSPGNNRVYYTGEVSLVFTITPHLQLNQKGIGWAATGLYSLDGKEKVYVSGSESGSGQTVLGNLSGGMHSIVVYAFFQHSYSLIPVPTSETRPPPVTFASQTIVFWVNSDPANTNVPDSMPDSNSKPDSSNSPDSFLASLIAVAVVASIAVISFGLVAYFMRRKMERRQHE